MSFSCVYSARKGRQAGLSQVQLKQNIFATHNNNILQDLRNQNKTAVTAGRAMGVFRLFQVTSTTSIYNGGLERFKTLKHL